MIRAKLLLRIFFWDGAKPDENWAQTILRVLGNLIRSFISLMLLLAFAIGGAVWLDSLPGEKERALDDVDVDIAYDSQRCTEENPIYIGVVNMGRKPVTNIQVQIFARQPQFSNSALVGYNWDHRITFRQIFEPGDGWRRCTRFETLPGYIASELVWSGEIIDGALWEES